MVLTHSCCSQFTYTPDLPGSAQPGVIFGYIFVHQFSSLFWLSLKLVLYFFPWDNKNEIQTDKD
jgi:hypothetical protein